MAQYISMYMRRCQESERGDRWIEWRERERERCGDNRRAGTIDERLPCTCAQRTRRGGGRRGQVARLGARRGARARNPVFGTRTSRSICRSQSCPRPSPPPPKGSPPFPPPPLLPRRLQSSVHLRSPSRPQLASYLPPLHHHARTGLAKALPQRRRRRLAAGELPVSLQADVTAATDLPRVLGPSAALLPDNRSRLIRRSKHEIPILGLSRAWERRPIIKSTV